MQFFEIYILHFKYGCVKEGRAMNSREFVKSTIMTMNKNSFGILKKSIIGEYIFFSVITDSEITKEVLAEKLCDYFEKVMLKTGKDFDKCVSDYLNNLSSIVEGKIVKSSQSNKNNDEKTRAEKYFDKAKSIKDEGSLSVQQLIDYTRIIMCLYSSAITDKHKVISNFDFSVSNIKPKKVIKAMKKEESEFLIIKNQRFNTKELYSSDTCTFVIAIILLYKMTENVLQEGTYRE